MITWLAVKATFTMACLSFQASAFLQQEDDRQQQQEKEAPFGGGTIIIVSTLLIGYLIIWWFREKRQQQQERPRTEAITSREDEPSELVCVCEFLEARELSIVQCLSKDWKLASNHRIRFLLEKKYDEDANKPLYSTLSLSQRLYHLETKALIPLWADKKVATPLFQTKIACPALGQLVMQMMKHSLSSQLETFHSRSSLMIGIRPREGRESHPFGELSIIVFQDVNALQLAFIRRRVTTADWSFQIVDRKWYLTGQDSFMKPGYKICTSWSPSQDMEKLQPEFRERNPTGIGILEEANVFWYTVQEYFLEPKYQLMFKRFCSLPLINWTGY